MEMASLNSMESIEISKTISADVDANAPAGTINLKTKRAFDRSGRRVSLTANLTAFSTRFNFDKSYGPDDRLSHKIYPGGIFDYSDVFFNKRLGVSFNVSESMAYSANARTTLTYNYTPTAADPRPVVPTAMTFLHAPRTNRRSTVNFAADFKATPRLVLSLGLLYNYADLNNPQRSLTFNTGARTTVVGADPLLSFTTTNAASVVANPAAIVKLGQTITALPKFEYRLGGLTVDAGVIFTANRSSLRSADWHITQIGGPDMADGASFTNPTITKDDGRYALTDVYSGEVTGTYRTTKFFPIVWKAGVKRRYEIRDFRLDTESLRYDLIGAPARGAWAGYRSPFEFDMGGTNTDAGLRSVAGGTVYMPDLGRLGALFRESPTRFAQNITATNFYNAFIGNRRNYEETIDGGFLMGTASLGKAILRAGLRRESTHTDSLEYDPRSPAELAKAGFAEAGGRATTIDGLKYQFYSKPKIHREGGYGNWFPSASLKYAVNRNLDLQFGFSTTIRRPTFRDVAGVWVINDDAVPQPTVDLPNPQLKPETSRNYSARAAYYFEPVGQFAVSAFQNSVKGLFIATTSSAAEYGYRGDLDLSNYLFRFTTQSARRVLVRGMEYEYSQSLSFLPSPFKGLGVRASYTRNYAEIPTVNMIPHSINAGLSYAFRRVNVYTNLNWRDNYPNVIATTATGTNRYYRHRANLDIGGGYRISDRYSFFFSTRNIFNEPYLIMEKVAANPAAVQFTEVNGINWTFGVKGVF
jgi:TonB-dependent receptor